MAVPGVMLAPSSSVPLAKGSTVAVAGMATSLFVVEVFARQRDVVLSLLAGVVLAAGVALLVHRPSRWSRLVLFSALAATTSIVAVIVVPDGGFREFFLVDRSLRWPEMLTWWSAGWADLATTLTTGIDGPYNIVLFVPAGFLWTGVTRKALVSVLALGALSFVIESLQAVGGFRTASPSDLVANLLGAVLGAAGALVLRRVWVLAATLGVVTVFIERGGQHRSRSSASG